MTESVKNLDNDNVVKSLKQYDADEINTKLGIIMALIMTFLGIFVASYLFMTYYEMYIRGEMEICPIGCEYVISWFMPLENDISFLAGMMAFMTIFGFKKHQQWAPNMLVITTIMLLQSAFWQMIPSMDAGIMPPAYLMLFVPALISYVIVAKYVVKASWGRIVVSMFTGMAMITAIINGTSSLNMFMKTGGTISSDTLGYVDLNIPAHIDTLGDPMFQITMRMNWIPGIIFGLITFSVLMKPREITRLLAIAASIMVLITGIPRSVMFTIQKGELSMMSYAPMIVTVILAMVLKPSVWKKLVDPIDM